jgi:hypothetical protein
MILRRLSVPTLFWIIACSPALAADGKATCPDGHTVSASTGTKGGSCNNYTSATGSKGVECTDGSNTGLANCAGYGNSNGSGSYTARKNAGNNPANPTPPPSRVGVTPPNSGGTKQPPSGGKTIGIQPPTPGGNKQPPSEPPPTNR